MVHGVVHGVVSFGLGLGAVWMVKVLSWTVGSIVIYKPMILSSVNNESECFKFYYTTWIGGVENGNGRTLDLVIGKTL